jgi:hypothetical protein
MLTTVPRKPLSTVGQLNVRVPEQLARFRSLIDECARRDGTSRQQAMRAALLRGLQQQREPTAA